MSESLRDDVL